MSYLTLPGGIPDFTKAVISLWFRVPQASIDAATAAFSSDYQDVPPLFNGIVPLVVMGEKGVWKPFTQTNEIYQVPDVPPGTYPDFILTTTSPTGESLPTNPVVIGINCDPGQARPVLYINIETGQKADVSDYQFDMRTAVPFSYVDVTDIFTDFTAAIVGTNIYLDRSGSGADRWHHLLISLDLPTIQTHGIAHGELSTGIDADYVDSAAKLFVALDDINYTQFDLSNWFVRGSTDNVVVPELAMKVAGAAQVMGYSASGPDQVPLGGIPQYSLGTPQIPCNTQPMGLPGTPELVDSVHHVEMAEFQMFTGLVVDTADEKVRRAFIDAKGKPVPPDKKKSKSDPQSGSIEFLGQRPVVLFHGSGKWKTGYNTGSSGTDSKGKKISSGQFTPTAKIASYRPDPSLHGKQSP